MPQILKERHHKMSAIRAARGCFRHQLKLTRSTVLRRGYAEAVSDKIKLTLALPHQVRFTFLEAHRLNLADKSRMLVYIQIPRCVRHTAQAENS